MRLVSLSFQYFLVLWNWVLTFADACDVAERNAGIQFHFLQCVIVAL